MLLTSDTRDVVQRYEQEAHKLLDVFLTTNAHRADVERVITAALVEAFSAGMAAVMDHVEAVYAPRH
jgi:hypothetical protein